MMCRKFGLWSLTGVLAALFAFQADAGATFYWRGGEGNWTDHNWDKGAVGTATAEVPGIEDSAYINGTNSIIHVDGTVEISQLWSLTEKVTEQNRIECTIVGSGKIRVGAGESFSASGTSLQINKYARLIMDGPDLEVVKGVNYAEGGEIIIKKGTWTMPSTFYIKTAPGKLIIDGGTLTGSGVITMQDGWKGSGVVHEPVGTLELKSGTLSIARLMIIGRVEE